MSVNWVVCGTCYTEIEGNELGGTELQRSSYHLDYLEGHPDVTLWLTFSHADYFVMSCPVLRSLVF